MSPLRRSSRPLAGGAAHLIVSAAIPSNRFDLLAITDDHAIRTLTLNRPEVRNALNMSLLKALHGALAEARRDSVRCLVLTGSGRGFCAGADIAEWAESESAAAQDDHDWVGEAQALIRDVAEFPVPTIALLNGAAAGAGLDLALACDFRFAAESARFVCAYTRMAYNPDAGGTWLLPRLVGLEAAKRFAFTGEIWSASEALARGLVSEVHPADQLADAAYGFARRLAAGPTLAQIETKRLMDAAFDRSLAEQLAAERLAGERCGRSEDAREAMDAAVARRDPVFKGR